MVLTGEDYWVPTKDLSFANEDSMLTGAYVPLGTETEPGHVIEGQGICKGAFFRAYPDGLNVERTA